MSSGNSSTSSSSGAGSQHGGFDPGVENKALSNYLYIICGAVSAIIILWRICDGTTKLVRTVACLNNDRQRYFAAPSPNVAFFKRHLLYAPIFRKRHNREFQLSSAINVGTLPTRFQLLFLAGYFATNVAFCVIEVPFAQSYEAAARMLLSRTGILATVNLVPLFLLAGRNNPLIPLLGISFDTYNLIHRWFGRIVILEALAHTLAYLAMRGWGSAFASILKSQFLGWGLIGTCAFVALGIQAFSPIRHAFYEFFKLLHIALAIVAMIGLWYHLKIKDFAELKYFYAAVGLWAADRIGRFLRILYSHLGGSRTKSVVEVLPGNACRLTMTLARPWNFHPGQHAYLYIPAISLWQSHPFTVAWVDGTDDVSADRLVTTHQDVMAMRQMQVSFIIRARTGFTDSLYKKALAAPGGKLEIRGFAEGPYGAQRLLDSYGTVLLFAGGVGITHQVPYVKALVAGYSEGTVATRKVVLVWTIQNPDHLEWIRPWMTEILAIDKRREILRVMLFISQPRSTKEIHSPSSTVQMFPGRPNIETLLTREQEHQLGAMAVTVCGPGSFSDEVRQAVRKYQNRTTIDFVEEAFSW